MTASRVVVIGGGMVGAALGYGLARQGIETLMLDEGDQGLRAARGNFGLLWVQGKGAEFPAYARWTLDSCRLWPEFAAELTELTGIDVQFRQRGGIHYCLDEPELEAYRLELAQQAGVSDGDFEYQFLSSTQLARLEPHINVNIPGACYSPNDGHVNPLYLLRALQAGFLAKGGHYRPRHHVLNIEATHDGFVLHTEQGPIRAGQLVLAAGLDNRRLAPMVGLSQPLIPQRGQLLITERLPSLLNYPSIYLRQTGEGSIQIGDSSEQVGLDDGNTPQVMAQLARRAISLLPALRHRHIVRGWGALRVLSPDGYPVYEQNRAPGPRAHAFSSHSGVTLAAVHALTLAPMLMAPRLSPSLDAFTPQRFKD